MVKTGQISLITQTGGGQDSTGNAIPTEDTLSTYVDCNLRTASKDYGVVVDGEFIKAKYIILVDNDLITTLGLDLTTIKNASIKNGNDEVINRFRIIDIQYMKLTRRVKITL